MKATGAGVESHLFNKIQAEQRLTDLRMESHSWWHNLLISTHSISHNSLHSPVLVILTPFLSHVAKSVKLTQELYKDFDETLAAFL